MIRLFITTDLTSTLNMYDVNSGYDSENAKAKVLLNSLPNEIEFDGNKIIICQDERHNNPQEEGSAVKPVLDKWDINSDNDFILYHQTFPPSDEILTKFKATKYGSHIKGDPHDKVYMILFDDEIKNKFSEILKVLGFTQEQIEEKNILESKLNFLHHCLTPDGLENEEVTNSDWAKLEGFNTLTEAKDGPFGENYLSALRTLRDKLLVS